MAAVAVYVCLPTYIPLGNIERGYRSAKKAIKIAAPSRISHVFLRCNGSSVLSNCEFQFFPIKIMSRILIDFLGGFDSTWMSVSLVSQNPEYDLPYIAADLNGQEQKEGK